MLTKRHYYVTSEDGSIVVVSANFRNYVGAYYKECTRVEFGSHDSRPKYFESRDRAEAAKAAAERFYGKPDSFKVISMKTSQGESSLRK